MILEGYLTQLSSSMVLTVSARSAVAASAKLACCARAMLLFLKTDATRLGSQLPRRGTAAPHSRCQNTVFSKSYARDGKGQGL